MTKKKVSLNRSEDLTSVDEELEEAMARLDGTNERINTVLTGIDEQGRGENVAPPPDSAETPPAAETAAEDEAERAPE